MKKWLAVAILSVSVGCGFHIPDFPVPVPTPDPIPTPTPSPYTEACMDLLAQGLPWCQDSGQTCGDCVHNPTSDPRSCEKAPECEPTPPPPDPLECILPEEASLKVADPQCGSGQFGDIIKLGTTALGDRSVSGQLPKEEREAAAKNNQSALANQMSASVCVIDGHDALFILRSDGRWDEYHVVSYSNAAWTNSGSGKYIGCHYVPIDPISLDGEFTIKMQYPARCEVDTTFKVHSLEYCNSKGFTHRTWCPLAQENAPDREALEERVIGKQLFWCDGEVVSGLDNPAKTICCGHVKTCTEDGRICDEKEF